MKEPPNAAASAPRLVPELDGLRALAIAAVIVFHCRTVADSRSGLERAYYAAAAAGWVGVDLFFVLSGFLITGILLGSVGSRSYFRSFYLRRALRIFPLYFAALALVSIGAHVVGVTRLMPETAWAEVAHWLFLQNWLPLAGLEWTRPLDHFWSLGVEEQFYLAWPGLVLLAARRRAVPVLCVGAIAVAIIGRALFELVGWSEGGNFATLTRMDSLAVGGYLACLAHQRALPHPAVAGAALALSLALVAAIAIAGGGFFRPTNGFIYRYAYLPLAVAFGALLVFALVGREQGPWRRLLRTRAFTALGRVSYGVYVIHWPVAIMLQPAFRTLSMGFWAKELTFLVAVASVSIGIAALSFRYFESPFLRLKDRFAPRPLPRSGATAA